MSVSRTTDFIGSNDMIKVNIPHLWFKEISNMLILKMLEDI